MYECQEDISWQAPSSDRFIFCSWPRTKCKTSIGNEFFQICHFNRTESFLMHLAEPHQDLWLKTGKYKSRNKNRRIPKFHLRTAGLILRVLAMKVTKAISYYNLLLGFLLASLVKHPGAYTVYCMSARPKNVF